MDWLVPVVGVVAVLAIGLWIWNVIAARIYRARLANGYLDFVPAEEAPSHPEEVRELSAEFEGCGYEPLTSHAGTSWWFCCTTNRRDPSERLSTSQTSPVSMASPFEVTSILEDGRGVLATGNAAMPSIHGVELRQTFPGASPSELVKHHGAAIQLLAEEGLGIRPVSRDEAELTRQEWFISNGNWSEPHPSEPLSTGSGMLAVDTRRQRVQSPRMR